jgi:hypothetical protein
MSYARIKELLENKDFNEAEELITESLHDKALDESHTEQLHLLRGEAYLGLNQIDLAIDETNTVLENNLDADSFGVAQAYKLRAKALLVQGNEKQADGLNEAAKQTNIRAAKKRTFSEFGSTDFTTPEEAVSRLLYPIEPDEKVQKTLKF